MQSRFDNIICQAYILAESDRSSARAARITAFFSEGGGWMILKVWAFIIDFLGAPT
jgi:hypothetical protein